jgi:hypothetical protein
MGKGLPGGRRQAGRIDYRTEPNRSVLPDRPATARGARGRLQQGPRGQGPRAAAARPPPPAPRLLSHHKRGPAAAGTSDLEITVAMTQPYALLGSLAAVILAVATDAAAALEVQTIDTMAVLPGADNRAPLLPGDPPRAGSTEAAGCFPGFSKACCAALAAAQASPAFQQAEQKVMGASGEAAGRAFAACAAQATPCALRLPNGTHAAASCCAASAQPFWASGFSAAAVAALRGAGSAIPGGGSMWWVDVNQTDGSGPAHISRKLITSQYPAWYPSACSPASIGQQETMFCSGAGPPVLQCHCTVSKGSSVNAAQLPTAGGDSSGGPVAPPAPAPAPPAPAPAAGSGVCDIYAKGHTPCVAAHSMVRALYSGYSGPLYSVWRRDTNKTAHIGVLSPGGVVDTAAASRFCSGARQCIVTRIFDQSPLANHLGIERGFAYLTPPRSSQDAGVDLLRASPNVTLGGRGVLSAVSHERAGFVATSRPVSD